MLKWLYQEDPSQKRQDTIILSWLILAEVGAHFIWHVSDASQLEVTIAAVVTWVTVGVASIIYSNTKREGGK